VGGQRDRGQQRQPEQGQARGLLEQDARHRGRGARTPAARPPAGSGPSHRLPWPAWTPGPLRGALARVAWRSWARSPPLGREVQRG
jgi:hypothetical protein